MEEKLHAELLKFVAHIAGLSIWDYGKDDGSDYKECKEPSDGYLDSHTCLMDMIETARRTLEKPAANMTTSASPANPDVTLVAEAYATDEHGDSPAFAVINANPSFMAGLLKYREICKKHNVQSVTTGDSPESWDNGDDLRIMYDALQVFGDEFWFSGNPKHADYGVETRNISITELLHMVETKKNDPVYPNFTWDGGVLFYSGDPGLLTDLIDTYKG